MFAQLWMLLSFLRNVLINLVALSFYLVFGGFWAKLRNIQIIAVIPQSRVLELKKRQPKYE